MARRIKTYNDCLRTLNYYFNLLNGGKISKEKAHQLRLFVMSILDVIKARDLEKLEGMIEEENELLDDWTE
jgi:hypothetical protein